MTNSNIPQQQTIVQYITNSAQTAYTFAFYAPLPTDIQVFYQASNAQPVPSADLLALNSQYSVSYNSDPTTGGTITLLFTPTTGYYLTINRQVAASLNTNFAQAQNFNGANLDAALDRLLLLIQQNLNYILQRNLSYVINTYLPNAQPFTQLPPLSNNQFWIGNGAGVVAATIAQVPSASVLQSLLASQVQFADGTTQIGFYNPYNNTAGTLFTFLNNLYNSPTLVTPNITGVTNASNAAAGSVGEFISSNVLIGSSVNFHNNVVTVVTSISLTAGDWDVTGSILVNDPNNQLRSMSCWSSTSNVSAPDASLTTGFNASATTDHLCQIQSFAILPQRYNVSTTTTVYLMVNAFTQSAGTMAACGYISARRRR